MKRPKVLYLTYEYNNSDGWARCTVNWINGLKEKVRYADILTLKSVPNEKSHANIKPFLLSANLWSTKKNIIIFGLYQLYCQASKRLRHCPLFD